MDDNLKAYNLVSFIVVNELVSLMMRKGLASPDDIREMYDRALLNLETQQSKAGDGQEAFRLARQIVEFLIKAV